MLAVRGAVRVVVAACALSAGATRVEAQARRSEVTAAPVEVTIGVTINASATDVSAAPTCIQLSLPCSHTTPTDWGGIGLEGSVDVAATAHAAVTALAGLSASAWDSASQVLTHRTSQNVVRAFLVGPTLRPRFFADGWEDDRVFLQTLAGVEDSTLFGSRPVIQINVGADVHPSSRRRGWEPTTRIEFGYRMSPGSTYPATSWRFFFGAVIGPHDR